MCAGLLDGRGGSVGSSHSEPRCGVYRGGQPGVRPCDGQADGLPVAGTGRRGAGRHRLPGRGGRASEPPERTTGRAPDPAGDVYSFGAILAVLIRQAGLTYDDADATTVELTANRSTASASPLSELADAAVTADPASRPTMREL